MNTEKALVQKRVRHCLYVASCEGYQVGLSLCENAVCNKLNVSLLSMMNNFLKSLDDLAINDLKNPTQFLCKEMLDKMCWLHYMHD